MWRTRLVSAPKRVPLAALGIGDPIIMESSTVQKVQIPKSRPAPRGADQPQPTPEQVEMLDLKRYDFTLQFAWQPTTLGGPQPPAPPVASTEPSFE